MADDTPPVGGRDPQAWRVRIFENVDLDDFWTHFGVTPDPQMEEELETIAAYDGKPYIIDDPNEAMAVARLFVSDNKFQRENGPFRRRLQYSIYPDDINEYCRKTNRTLWAPRAEFFAKWLKFDAVKHPMGSVAAASEIQDLHDFRSLQTFQALAKTVAEQLQTVSASRRLTVLYPGSGTHIAPLITAMQLVDDGKIDSAEFIYTEIDGAWKSLFAQFRRLFGAGVFETIQLSPERKSGEDCSERTFTLKYKGKIITLTEAVHCSGDSYYRDADLQRADLVVIHDPGPAGYLYFSYSLLAMILHDRKRLNDNHQQMAVVEAPAFAGDGEVDLGVTPVSLPGRYGHCKGVDGIGEFKECFYKGQAVRLDNQALQALVGGKDRDQILAAIFHEPANSKKEREDFLEQLETEPDHQCKIVKPYIDARMFESE